MNGPRASVIKYLKDEEKAEKEARQKLMDDTRKARMQAELMGMDKAKVQAMGLPELQGFIEGGEWLKHQQKQQQEAMANEQEAQAETRDRNVLAASTTGSLTPAQLKYFMGKVNAPATKPAEQMWNGMTPSERYRVLGGQSEDTWQKLMEDERKGSEAQQKAQSDYQRLSLDRRKVELDERRFEAGGMEQEMVQQGLAVPVQGGKPGQYMIPVGNGNWQVVTPEAPEDLEVIEREGKTFYRGKGWRPVRDSPLVQMGDPFEQFLSGEGGAGGPAAGGSNAGAAVEESEDPRERWFMGQ